MAKKRQQTERITPGMLDYNPSKMEMLKGFFGFNKPRTQDVDLSYGPVDDTINDILQKRKVLKKPAMRK